MLIRANDIIGAKIYTISGGKEIEEVRDIIFSPNDNRVIGFLVDTAGLFSDAKVIFLEDIKSIGKDAILVESESVVKNSGDIPQNIAGVAENNNFLNKTKVITENGINLGRISDILFDPATGLVQEFEVSQGFMFPGTGKKTVHIEDIVTVGKDATIVRGYTESKFAEQEESRGAKGMGKERLRRVGRGGGLQIYAQSVRIEGGRAKTIRKKKASKKR